MGSQRPLGCASSLRRTGTPLQLPSACLRGSNSLKFRCFRGRLVCPSAAIGFSEVLAGPWSENEALSGALAQDAELLRSTVPGPGHVHGHRQHPSTQSPSHDQHRARQQQHQQQQQEAAQQLVQRLVPSPTPVASATKLHPRSGVSGIGVALGILLTVALQLVGRWLQRQRWAQQVMELLDLRRSSGSSASTSGKGDSAGGADGAESGGAAPRRPGGRTAATGSSSRRRGSSSGAGDDGTSADGPGADGSGGSAATKSAFLNAALQGSLSLPANLSSLGAVDGAAAEGYGARAGLGHGAALGASGTAAGAAGSVQLPAPPGPGADPGESVEWVNMCWRKVWRVYQRGLERWIIDLLQPVFDGLVKDGSVPRWLCRLRVVELTLDHEAPYFSNMRRRNSRKDSDLNGVVDLRYTGGARMLLMLELGEGRWRFKVPVLVSDLDLECQMWLKLRLAPMCPWIGTISLAFVGPPNVKVQLSPYNRVRLMRVPVVQNYLRKLLTVDLPGLMVLPQRLEINIPPSVTTIAEAAVGRDTIMRAVASAVLQADAVEAALLAALPLGPQTPAGGITLPEAFKGELSVTLREARNLPVWGFPGQSNPYCRLVLGDQAVQSRREGDTSHPGRHRAPVWNQEFQFLVEDPQVQVLEILVKDSHLTGRTDVGRATIKLQDILAAQHGAEGGKVTMWIPLSPPVGSYAITGGEAVPTGDVLLELTYKSFDDDEHDSGYREAENYFKQAATQAPITDIRSAAAASSRAAVAASAAVSAIAMTRAAAARAAARAARVAQEAAAAAAGAAKGAVDQGASIIAQQQQQQTQRQPVAALPPAAAQTPKQLPAKAASAAAPTQAASDRAAAAAATARATARPESPVEGATTVSEPAVGGVGAARPPTDGVESSVSAADLTHVVTLPPSPVHRVRVTTVEDEDEEVVAVPGGDGKVVAGSEETQARALAASVAAATTIAATAVHSSAGVRSAAATAVLERPPANDAHAVREAASSNGHLHSSRGRRWRQRRAGAGGGGDGDGGSATASHDDDSEISNNGGGGGDGGGAGTTSSLVAVQALELPDRPVDAHAVRDPMPTSPSLPLQHRIDDQEPIDVAVEVVATRGPAGQPAAAKPEGQGQVPAAPAASGGGGGGAGPVLSALAHLTASAHALTATAIDKARESLSHKQQQTTQQPEAAKELGETDGSSGSGGGNWLEAIVSRLPRYGSPPQEDEAPPGGREADEGSGGAAAAKAHASGATGDDDSHPWWQFWVPKGGAAKLYDSPSEGDAAAGSSDAAAAAKGSAAEPAGTEGRSKPWWQFWPDGESERDEEKGKRRGEGEVEEDDDRSGSKPVEAIYIPPDLPLEEIAAEVQRLKEDSWRERSDHVSNLWMKAVERNDRKWLMLAAFLLSVAVGLLTVVAWRLEQLEHLQAAAPQIALMTMQAALQALEQQAGGSGLL